MFFDDSPITFTPGFNGADTTQDLFDDIDNNPFQNGIVLTDEVPIISDFSNGNQSQKTPSTPAEENNLVRNLVLGGIAVGTLGLIFSIIRS